MGINKESYNWENVEAGFEEAKLEFMIAITPMALAVNDFLYSEGAGVHMGDGAKIGAAIGAGAGTALSFVNRILAKRRNADVENDRATRMSEDLGYPIAGAVAGGIAGFLIENYTQ